MVIWNSKIAAWVKFAYKIFFGSINPNNPHYNPKLRETLQYFNRCLVCRLTDEWKYPQGIVVSGKTLGRCSAKVADPIVLNLHQEQYILEGEDIIAITDHSALTWSKTYQSVNKRLLKWGHTYAAHPGLKIIHKAGRVHSNVQ